jgi:hypothetical protein
MWDEGPHGGDHDHVASTKYAKAARGVFVTAGGWVWSVRDFRSSRSRASSSPDCDMLRGCV